MTTAAKPSFSTATERGLDPFTVLSKRELRIMVVLSHHPTLKAPLTRFIVVIHPDTMGVSIEPVPPKVGANFEEMDVVVLDHGLNDNSKVKIVHDYLSPLGSLFMLCSKG